MRLLARVLESANIQPTQVFRSFSSFNPFRGISNEDRFDSLEPDDDFESRIFGDITGNEEDSSPYLRKIDRVEKNYDKWGMSSRFNPGNRSGILDDLGDNFSTLSDGMDDKLSKAATYFEVDPDEIEKEDYSFRHDVDPVLYGTYDTKDLDLRKPGVQKPFKRIEFETTTEEVLKKADFRNVRFLANFITEGGIIIKRSKTGISAKAQRKVARAIKTARAFGLMPFTTMGSKQFVFGQTMESRDEDYHEYRSYRPPNFVDEERTARPPLEA